MHASLFCLDCQTITDEDTCPECGSSLLFSEVYDDSLEDDDLH